MIHDSKFASVETHDKDRLVPLHSWSKRSDFLWKFFLRRGEEEITFNFKFLKEFDLGPPKPIEMYAYSNGTPGCLCVHSEQFVRGHVARHDQQRGWRLVAYPL